MKSYLESELTDLVQRIESQAVLEALDKVLSQLNIKADKIEYLLYSDEAIRIRSQSKGKKFQRIDEARRKLKLKQRTLYEIARTIKDIQSRLI